MAHGLGSDLVVTMREANGQTSLFEDQQQRSEFLAAYDRVMADRWPVPWQSKQIETRFGTTHVIESGPADGKPIVLLHGGGTCSAMWFSIVGYLAEAGYRTIAFDRVGDVGRSTIKELPDDAQKLADWLLDCLDATGLDSPPMIGLSYGAFLNINFARYYPDRIDSIVMLTPGGVFAKLRLWWTLRMMISIGSGYRPLIRNAFSYISGGREPDADLFELARLAWSIWKGPEYMPPVYSDEELRAVTHPSLLLVGDRDVIYSPTKVIQRARNTMPNLAAELIPGGGHTLSTDEPKAVSQRVVSFLAECSN